MSMTAKVLVMYASDYSMPSEREPGVLIQGCSLQYYFFGEKGEELNAKLVGSTGPVGFQRAKCICDVDLRKKITRLPAVFDATFQMSVGSDGKAVQKVVDLDNCVDVDFTKILAPAATKTAASATSAAK